MSAGLYETAAGRILRGVTPDLDTRVDSEALTQTRIEAIAADKLGRPELLPVGSRHAWTMRGRKRRPALFMPTMHDYLADDADWNADSWIFEPEGLLRLRATMEWLFGLIPEPMTFQAVWIGDAVESEPVVRRSEFLEIVDADEIGTKRRYRLPSDAG